MGLLQLFKTAHVYAAAISSCLIASGPEVLAAPNLVIRSQSISRPMGRANAAMLGGQNQLLETRWGMLCDSLIHCGRFVMLGLRNEDPNTDTGGAVKRGLMGTMRTTKGAHKEETTKQKMRPKCKQKTQRSKSAIQNPGRGNSQSGSSPRVGRAGKTSQAGEAKRSEQTDTEAF